MAKKQAQSAEPTTAAQQGTLQLPYEEITTTANRDTVREVGTRGREGIMIDIDMIQPRGGIEQYNSFNPRFKPEHLSMEEWMKELEIEDFAMDLLHNGHITPIEGDFTQDGKIFYITEGFRRKMAIQWLLDNGYTHYKNDPKGKVINKVEVMQNPKDWTEEDRVARTLSSNNNLKLKPIEYALKLSFWKNTWNRSNEELAKRLGKSRQWVDNMLEIAAQTDYVKDKIKSGEIKPTAVLSISEKDPQKKEQIIKDAINSGKSISVKDAKNLGKSAFDEFKEMLKTEIDKYKEGVIAYSQALQNMKELAAKAETAKAGDKGSIKFALDTAIKWLDEAETKSPEGEDDADSIDYGNYVDLMDEIVDEVLKGNIPSLTGIDRIKNITKKAIELSPEDSVDIYAAEEITISKINPNGIKTETKAAMDAEEKSRQTSAKNEASRPRNQKDDALMPIDFTKDKELGEFELNEAIKLGDKLSKGLDTLPDHLTQYKKDWQGLITLQQQKIQAAKEIIKKAGNTR